MQFEDTKTYLNLARSFAGEAQAGMRYQLAARLATQQGYVTLADTIRTLAKNETVHARRFFEELSKRGQKLDNIDLDAGYPFHGGSLEECLRYAAQDERAEHTKIYPDFAAEAEAEGFSDVAALYRLVANVEKRHEMIFNYLYEAYKSGTLFSNESPMLYICSECGYMHTGTKAWDVCPLCKSSQGYVELHLPFEKERI
ncbi:MAG TPA: rubrerythrin family protein [Candidatus Coproplasma excrementigallinarum]|uniref:Rubrerythrin family protein n=1 Tax=Candidatus Coproplasma excrementigallinarum TaxID=2840747 RepID=A0A9D1SJ09_9FIRM|nr:rubrerythrin family protein [Candidatus Coproplasma excrementigallinarum]